MSENITEQKHHWKKMKIINFLIATIGICAIFSLYYFISLYEHSVHNVYDGNFSFWICLLGIPFGMILAGLFQVIVRINELQKMKNPENAASLNLHILPNINWKLFAALLFISILTAFFLQMYNPDPKIGFAGFMYYAGIVCGLLTAWISLNYNHISKIFRSSSTKLNG